MRDFRKKRSMAAQRTIFLGLGALFLLFLALLSLRAAWGMYGKLLAAADEEQVAKTQLKNLQDQKERISQATASLSSERGTEAEIRQRYGVAKPGEGEIHVVSVEPTAASTSQSHPSLLQRLWYAFQVW